jgi:hypothetical protein
MSTSLLALLDDIATVLDDVAVMTKVATKKTAGLLGDDLALNAEQVAGVKPNRELPVVWAVAKGSAINKAILVPAGLLISALAPWLVTPLLMIGGAFLCYEGFEKVAHKLLHHESEDHREHKERVDAISDEKVDMVAFEKKKIRGAIRTDFILSAEIIVITLGSVGDASLALKASVLTLIAVLTTVGIYGLVAGIVKLDDAGLALRKRASGLARAIGAVLLRGAPFFMRSLSVVGTAAMFLVGGGIIRHAIGLLERSSARLEAALAGVDGVGPVLGAIGPLLFDAVVGIALGAVCVGIVSGARRVVGRKPDAAT